MNTYFCTSSSLNPEPQLDLSSSLSLKLICSLLLDVNTKQYGPFATCKHSGQSIPTGRRGFVEGWPICIGFQADCVNGRRRGWEGLIKQGHYTKKTTFWTQQMAQRGVRLLTFSTEGTTQWVPQTIRSLYLEPFMSKSLN